MAKSEHLILIALFGCIGVNLVNYLISLFVMTYLNLCSNTKAMADVILADGSTAESPISDAIPVSKATIGRTYTIAHIDDSKIRSKLENAGINIGAHLIVNDFEDGKYATEINGVTVSVSQDAARHIFVRTVSSDN